MQCGKDGEISSQELVEKLTTQINNFPEDAIASLRRMTIQTLKRST
jgi:hypothetical protein